MMSRRARLNLTQEDLAARAGVSLRSITLWEGGTGEPTLRMVHRLAEALSVSPGWLIGDDEQSAPASAAESATRFRVRTDRMMDRMKELSDSEFGRIEPVVLGLIEAVIGCRTDQMLSSASKAHLDEMEAKFAAADLEAVRSRRSGGDAGGTRPSTPTAAGADESRQNPIGKRT